MDLIEGYLSLGRSSLLIYVTFVAATIAQRIHVEFSTLIR